VVALLGSVTTAVSASTGKPLYRTDHQAEVFLEHGLRTWAGLNLRTADFKSATCFNGYYSKREQRTHHHYPQGHENRYGENTFRSFACTLAIDSRSFHLYVVTARTGWRVMVDR
jgi:hypothetical protein